MVCHLLEKCGDWTHLLAHVGCTCHQVDCGISVCQLSHSADCCKSTVDKGQ